MASRKTRKGLEPTQKTGFPDRLYSPEEMAVLRQEYNETRREKKMAQIEKFDERMSEQLDVVATLLAMCTDLAADPDIILSPAQMQKMSLGIKAGQIVLDRQLGKAVTRVEGKVEHTIVNELLKTNDEWVIEADVTDE